MNVPPPKDTSKNSPPPPPRNKPSARLFLDAVRETLERFDAAQRKRRLAGLSDLDNAAYEWELAEAGGEELAAGRWLADLLMQLIRYAARHRPEALAAALARAAWPELIGECEDLVRRVMADELPALLAAMKGGRQ